MAPFFLLLAPIPARNLLHSPYTSSIPLFANIFSIAAIRFWLQYRPPASRAVSIEAEVLYHNVARRCWCFVPFAWLRHRAVALSDLPNVVLVARCRMLSQPTGRRRPALLISLAQPRP